MESIVKMRSVRWHIRRGHRRGALRRTLLCGLALVAAGAVLLAPTVAAQAFPEKPIKMITPFATGGASDVIARIVATKMTSTLGQPVVVDNKAGAGGAIGMEAVAQAAPDGYTIAFNTTSTIIVVPLTRPDLTYPKRLMAVGHICNVPLVFIARPGLEANSVAELVALARRNPGKISYGSSGIGGLPHVMGEGFKLAANVDMLHVPYKGDAQNIPAVLSGELDTAFVAVASAQAMIESGKIKGLAIAGSKRAPGLPNVPTFAEAGYPDSSIDTTYGLLAPIGTPKAIVDKIADAMISAVNAPDVQDQLRRMNVIPVGAGAGAYTEVLRRDTESWAKVVGKMDLKGLAN